MDNILVKSPIQTKDLLIPAHYVDILTKALEAQKIFLCAKRKGAWSMVTNTNTKEALEIAAHIIDQAIKT